ncbi:MAG: hypothetical protein K0A89_05630 [ANME-2 cluster archaeon]|nr:hypothetical protein [ANME-2 cluster archaeon]
MNIKDIFIITFASAILIYFLFFFVGYQQVSFNEDNTALENQYGGREGKEGHYGLDELYATVYAGILLFMASIISTIILYGRFGKSRFTWRPVIGGIFTAGFMGLGEALEHNFDTLWHEFFHYLVLLGGLVAMFFLYIGTQEYRMQYRQGGTPTSSKVILGIIIILPMVAFAIALNAIEPYDARVELPFIYLTATPTLFLSALTMLESYRQKEENKVLMGFLAMLAGTVTGLTVIIFLARIGDIGNHAFIFILGQSLQVVYMSATAMLILVFTFTMWALADSK